MKTNLTRHVLRQLYQCALYNDARCGIIPLSSQCLIARQRKQQPALRIANVQRRTLFNFFRKTKSGTKEARLAPGYNTLIELEEKLKVRVRPPPPTEVYDSLWRFISTKQKQEEVTLDDTQVRRIKVAFEHLKREANDGVWQDQFTPDGIGQILQLLVKTAVSVTNKGPVLELATALYKEARRLADEDVGNEQPRFDRYAYISIVASCGQALKAKHLLLDSLDSQQGFYWTCINRIARGLIKEGKDEDLRTFVSDLEAAGAPLNSNLQRHIIAEYAQSRKDLQQAHYWYKYPLPETEVVSSKSRRVLLGLCIQSDNIEVGDELVKEITQQDPDDKMAIDQVLQWALCKGKGLDAIARMIKTMQERHHDKPHLQPNISTINTLAGLAISKLDDPYIAERYIEMGRGLGLTPNASTHILQMKYKTDRKDFSGALTSFDALQTFNPSEIDTEAINQLIVAMCEHESQRNESIMSLADYLSDRKAPFLPATVAALARFHIYRHEIDDLRDLITMYVASFGTADRELVCVSLIDYVLDPESATKEAWDTWNIARNAFPETPVAVRTQVMKAFFKRNRPDLGTHVFGQMRFSQIPELRPAIDTYVECIVGVGEFADLQNLESVHNMFKLDTEVEPCTKIFNALMLSYARCSEARKALGFWDAIIGSPEGPTYSSIQIAFKACESSDNGVADARGIWKVVKSSEIEMTSALYAAYVGAIAAHSQFEEAVALCNNATRLGFEVDALLLGTFHNVSPESRKPRVKEWARRSHPEAYKQLLKCKKLEYTPPDVDDDPDSLPPETKTYFDIRHLGRNLKP